MSLCCPFFIYCTKGMKTQLVHTRVWTDLFQDKTGPLCGHAVAAFARRPRSHPSLSVFVLIVFILQTFVTEDMVCK